MQVLGIKEIKIDEYGELTVRFLDAPETEWVTNEFIQSPVKRFLRKHFNYL